MLFLCMSMFKRGVCVAVLMVELAQTGTDLLTRKQTVGMEVLRQIDKLDTHNIHSSKNVIHLF